MMHRSLLLPLALTTLVTAEGLSSYSSAATFTYTTYSLVTSDKNTPLGSSVTSTETTVRAVASNQAEADKTISSRIASISDYIASSASDRSSHLADLTGGVTVSLVTTIRTSEGGTAGRTTSSGDMTGTTSAEATAKASGSAGGGGDEAGNSPSGASPTSSGSGATTLVRANVFGQTITGLGMLLAVGSGVGAFVL